MADLPNDTLVQARWFIVEGQLASFLGQLQRCHVVVVGRQRSQQRQRLGEMLCDGFVLASPLLLFIVCPSIRDE